VLRVSTGCEDSPQCKQGKQAVVGPEEERTTETGRTHTETQPTQST